MKALSLSEIRRVHSQLAAKSTMDLAEKLMKLEADQSTSPLIGLIKEILADRLAAKNQGVE